jgi:hypothetical protein
MKRTLIAAAGFALFAASGLAGAASWSVVVQPGVYGRVAIGGYAEAPLVYAPQPVVAVDNGYGEVVEETVDPAYATDQPPVYLWVPEYQRTHWAQYSREYGAYGVPVYFVDDGWYRANVMRRNWTPEQRSWSQQQWLEQDRLARDRFERQRFEQQRYEQQQRWESDRVWHDPRQQRNYDSSEQSRWDRERAEQDAQNRMRWGSARGVLPGQAQSSNPSRQQPGGGQWQGQGGNGGHQGGNPSGGYQPGNGPNGGNGGQQAGAGQWQGGNGGRPGGYQQGNAGQRVPTPPQQQGSGVTVGQGGAERRGDDRGQGRIERRGQGEARGAFEHAREGNREGNRQR